MCKYQNGGLKQLDTGVGTCFDLFFGPDGGLDFTDVGFVEKEHAQTALSDASADRIRELAFEEEFVECE